MPNTYSSEWKEPSYLPLSLTMFAWNFVVVEEYFFKKYIFFLVYSLFYFISVIYSHVGKSHTYSQQMSTDVFIFLLYQQLLSLLRPKHKTTWA